MVASDSSAVPQTRPHQSKKKKLLIAVHGIGDQVQCSTIQQISRQLCRFYGHPADIPLGKLHASIISHSPPFGLLDRITFVGGIQQGATLGSILVDPVKEPEKFVPLLNMEEGEKHFEKSEFDFGLAEIYWADIAREFARDGHSLEEAKAWAKTIIARAGNRTDLNSDLAAKVFPQIIEGIHVLENVLFLANKAFGVSFDLAQVLRDYIGDVQQVAEFENIRKQILTAFLKALSAIYDKNSEAEIYFFAHSEGSVVTFLALLKALSERHCGKTKEDRDAAAWVDNVRGLMTIGSPIDKHLVLWPELFEPFEKLADNPALSARISPKIQWRNYYDFGDPVGFDLDRARVWLKEHSWDRCFEFEDETPNVKHDFGFARYVFPGKAHLDYFDDDQLFDHFFQEIVRLKPLSTNNDGTTLKPSTKADTKPQPPKNRLLWPFIPVSWIATAIPYLLSFAVLILGIYLFYRGAATYLPFQETAWDTARNVSGIALLLWGLSFATSVVRTSNVFKRKTYFWQGIAYLVAGVGIVAAYQLLTDAALLRSIILIPEEIWKGRDPKGLYGVIVAIPLLLLLGAIIWVQHFPLQRRLLSVAGIATILFVSISARIANESQYVKFWRVRSEPATHETDLRALENVVKENTAPQNVTESKAPQKVPETILQPYPFQWRLWPTVVATTKETRTDELVNAPDNVPTVVPIVKTKDPPPAEVWPLLLGSAMLSYLWWLSIILLDLTIMWHMYIRGHREP